MSSFSTCIHEASHAVAAHVGGCVLIGVLAKDDTPKGAYCLLLPSMENPRKNWGAAAIAGAIGQSMHARSHRAQTSTADEQAFIQAASGQPDSFRRECELEAKQILQRYWPCVLAVARALKRKQQLTGKEVSEIIEATTDPVQVRRIYI